jgi:hypothetical protein
VALITDNYKIEKDRQYVYLNSLRLKGVQNVSTSYQKNISIVDYFGNNEIAQLPNGEPNGQCTINSLYLTSDPFIAYTGDMGSNFYLLRSSDSIEYDFSFTSGYMISYSQQCGIGEIPSISTVWQAFGNIGNLSQYNYSLSTEDSDPLITEDEYNIIIDNISISEREDSQYLDDLNSIITGNESSLADNIVGYNSIGLSIDDFNTNRVSQYSFSIQSQRNPKYKLGQIRPNYVLPIRPVQIDINLEYEIDRYELDSLRQDPCNPTSKDITITAKNYKTKNTILSYSFSDMKLIGESYSSNTESYVTVSATYRTFLN